ncbi:ferric enterobactin uptake protein FepE [Photobacterium aphoticum]|uniref:Ferric enterobactin uptake protein FepE n=1 Tax=Photobacterium aphoticum TaxID=754436 RepID=A0A090R0K0_9GAMM|nr:ferric enterobactin uptake protein FepE [Photobacterium aphoticum]
MEQYKVFIEQINRLDTSDSDEQKLEKLYALWANRLSSKMLPDKSYVLFATSNNAESSYQLLTAYVKFVNLNVRKNLINNLNAVIESKYHELNQYREILIEQSKNKIEIEKEKTKIALQLAIAAGVSEPIESVSSNNLFSFYVGSKALAEKVKILDELKNYNLVEPELQSVEAKLSLISTLGVDKNLSLKAYRYQREPSLPISYAGPGNVIIIVIFILIGVLLSTVFVLIRSAIKMNKTNYVECKSGK